LRNTLFILLVFSFSCKLNKVDEHFRKQGKWVLYYDNSEKHIMNRGHYINNKQIGKWKYYNPNGGIYLKEKYQKDNWVKTVYYFPNGKKNLEGMAFYVSTTDTTYYRWEGYWKQYDSTGVIKNSAFYKFGKFAWFKKSK